MENQEIKVEDLQVGDEVLYGSSQGIRYLRILRPLKIAKKKNYRGDIVYSKVKCSWREDEKQWQMPGRSYIYTDKVQILTPENHNKEGYVDFNYKKIWLVKRRDI